MKETLERLIVETLGELGLEARDFTVEHPADLSHGDYSTNVALVLAKSLGSPQDLARKIADHLESKKDDNIEKIEIAGPGFINFYLSKEFFRNSLAEIIEKGEDFGKSKHAKGLKVMVEHTDPNPFKEFHIGHLMPNVIGTSISKILEWNGAEVKQANYQGDVGLHVAKAVWALLKGEGINAYAVGNKAYESDEGAKAEIEILNKKIYTASDEAVSRVYAEGREKSLKYFEKIYNKLGSKFDYYFFESETAPVGKEVVEENIGTVFEESEGAVVFKGSHTRVFINSQGLPTYEAKDLGNAKMKYEKYPYDLSVVVTGNEIKEYFRVVLEAMSQVLPELAQKTKHLPHGMLRLPTGKMSSRTGDVITAEELIEEVKKRTEGNEAVAIGAIKYMILKQSIGSDIVFDIEKSVSTEGDSGVYLQYAYARSRSILEKATGMADTYVPRETTHDVEKLLYRFPEIAERAGAEYAPHYVATYLTELAASFNRFYAQEQVISQDAEAPYRLAIVEAFSTVMKNGLGILAIPALERI